MKVKINNDEINLTASLIEDLDPSITLIHGRRFTYQSKDNNGFKNISLNDLISSVKNAAINSEQNPEEIKDFVRVFRSLKEKGYEASIGEINKQNLLTRIVTRIKHFFSSFERDRLLKELDGIIKKKHTEEGNAFSNVLKGMLDLHGVVQTPERKELTQYIDNADLQNAEKLLQRVKDPKELINGMQNSDGSYGQNSYLLDRAIEKGNFEMVKLLLDFLADPNIRGRVGNPIELAVKLGNHQIVKLLLERGADPSKLYNILTLGIKNETYFENVQTLVEFGAPVNWGDDISLLAWMAQKCNKNPEKVKEILSLMVSKGAVMDDEKPNEKIPEECKSFLRSLGITVK